jgi:hypothetical protein
MLQQLVQEGRGREVRDSSSSCLSQHLAFKGGCQPAAVAGEVQLSIHRLNSSSSSRVCTSLLQLQHPMPRA